MPPSSAAAPASHPLTGRWTFRTQAYSGKKPNDFGAEYALTVHEEGGILRATTWRIKYVDGGVPGKPSEAYAAEIALTPITRIGRTWYVATFEFDGPTAVKPRNFAFTVAGTHILGAWMWPPDGLYGVLYGDRGEAVTQRTEQVVFWLPSFPPDAQCVAVGCDDTSGAAWLRQALLALP